MRFLASWLAVVGCVGVLVACGDDDGIPPVSDGGTLSGVRVVFAPTSDPIDFGAVPWPDDLYLGADGHIDVGALPGEARAPFPAYWTSLRTSLRTLDGFGVVSPVYFYLDGAIDPETLPATPAASLREDATVFLMDVDEGSAEVLRRRPVLVDWEPEEGQLALRPADGYPLRPGARYAAVVTSGVQSTDASPVLPSDTFAEIRDAATRPADPLWQEIWDRDDPVLASLASNGVPRSSVVGLAVFRVQTVGTELADARAIVQADESPEVRIHEVISGAELDERLGTPVAAVPGLGVEGGVLHANVGWMIHGETVSPNFLSADRNVHGPFSRDADGRLEVKREDVVPFTVWLPVDFDGPAQVVVFQHGITGERGDALGLVDTLCGAGYAVYASDAPWHGMRTAQARADEVNQYTGADAPDRFGDITGTPIIVDFAGILDGQGPLESFHPVYFRDALRQSVVDLYQGVHVLQRGDFSAVGELDPALAGKRFFSSEPIGFVGNSLGGIIGTMFVATEPLVGAAVLSVTGGHLSRLVEQSPAFNPAYIPQLFPILGFDEEQIDYETYPPTFYPALGIWQTLLDRGDAIAYTRQFSWRNVELLLLMARNDETVPNVATEGLARAIGVPISGGAPEHVDLPTGMLPLRGNVAVGERLHTRGLHVYPEATHGLLIYREGAYRWMHPVAPPFVRREVETPVMNPVAAAQGQMLHFFETWRAGVAEITSLEN